MAAGCAGCTQSVLNPWWQDSAATAGTGGRDALGLIDGEVLAFQWYLYVGGRAGSTTFLTGGHDYRAGRLGAARFVSVAAAHVREFEARYGYQFVLLGGGDNVTLDVLRTSPLELADLVPDESITARVLASVDLKTTGDILGSEPDVLAGLLSIEEEAARTWILALRDRLGFSNVVADISDDDPPPPPATVEPFDFGILHGIGDALAATLVEGGIVTSADFLGASVESLAELMARSNGQVTGWQAELQEIVDRAGD